MKAARGDGQLHGITQVAAAKQIGVSLRTFQAWEQGTAFPQPRYRERLSNWLAARERLEAA